MAWLTRRRYRPAPGSIPTARVSTGSATPTGRVIYVGKAKNLRSRLTRTSRTSPTCTRAPRPWSRTAAKVEWTVVQTEVEALQLEYSWIKEFDPRFNVKYRDDKSYPWLAVTLNEEFPRVMVGRGAKRKGTRYFGPYSHAWAIRETVDLLLRVFPMRSCSAGVFKRTAQIGRPCLLGYIGKCSAPCVGRVDAEEHREIVEDFCDFMAGQTAAHVQRLETEMRAASRRSWTSSGPPGCATTSAPCSGRWRRTRSCSRDGTDADVIALAEDPLEVAVQIFYVRGGRIRGQRGWVADRVDDADTAELVEALPAPAVRRRRRGDAHPARGPGAGAARRRRRRSTAVALRPARRAVSIRVPQRGDKRALMETVARNAAAGARRCTRPSGPAT